jgi:hypothetical protein
MSVMCGCEVWQPTLRERHGLKVFLATYLGGKAWIEGVSGKLPGGGHGLKVFLPTYLGRKAWIEGVSGNLPWEKGMD